VAYSVEAVLKATGARQFSQAFQDASKSVQGLKKSAGNIKNVGKNISSVGDQLTRKVTKPAVAATSAAVGLTSALGWKRLVGLDTAKAQLKGLGYSAGEVETIIKHVENAVEGGTTTIAEGTAVAAGALAAGVEEGEELERYIRLVGDAAVGANRPVAEMAQIFNRVQGSGRLTRNELDMIEHSMPGFSQAMAEHVGAGSLEAFHEMVSAGEVGSEEFLDVMEDFAGGMSEAYSKSWSGMVKNTFAYIGQIGEALLEGVFQMSKEEIADFIEVLKSDEVKDWAERTGKAIHNAFQTAREIISGVKSSYDNLSPSVQKVLKYVTLFGSIALVSIGPITQVVGGLVSRFGMVISAVSRVAGAFTALASPIGLVILAIVGIVSAIIYLWNTNEEFREFFINIWENIKNIFVNVWETISDTIVPIIEEIVEFVREIWGMFVEFWNENSERILEIAQNVWNAISTVIETVLNIILTVMQTVWPIVEQIVKVAWETIKGVVEGAIDVVLGIIQFFASVLTGDWEGAWDAVKQILDGALNIIKSVIKGAFNLIKTIITTVLNAIKSVVSSVWNGIKNAISTVLDTIKTIIKNVWNGIKNTISNIINGIKSTISNTWNGIKSTVSNVVNSIKTAVSNKFSSMKNAVSNKMSDVKSAVSEGITNALNAVTDMATSFFDAGKNIVTSIIDGIKAAPGKITDAIKDMAGAARDFLPFSPAKTGPLRDLDKLDFAGPLVDSIKSAESSVSKAMGRLLGSDGMRIGEQVEGMHQMAGNRLVSDMSIAGTAETNNVYELNISIPLDSKTLAKKTVRYTAEELQALKRRERRK